jgi:hypothetical protein
LFDSLDLLYARLCRWLSPVNPIAMAHSEHHQEVSEKKILVFGAVVLVIIVALISYFEWQGRHVY